MTGWLLDTNILAELRKPRPEPRVISFLAAQPLERLHVSSVTLAEIRFGIEIQPDADRRADLSDWLRTKVRPMFAERILPVSEDVLVRWRLLIDAGRKAGVTFSQPDSMIAATALQHDLTIVSRDANGFARTGAALFNPWRD